MWSLCQFCSATSSWQVSAVRLMYVLYCMSSSHTYAILIMGFVPIALILFSAWRKDSRLWSVYSAIHIKRWHVIKMTYGHRPRGNTASLPPEFNYPVTLPADTNVLQDSRQLRYVVTVKPVYRSGYASWNGNERKDKHKRNWINMSSDV